jgi:hypothetical protein
VFLVVLQEHQKRVAGGHVQYFRDGVCGFSRFSVLAAFQRFIITGRDKHSFMDLRADIAVEVTAALVARCPTEKSYGTSL